MPRPMTAIQRAFVDMCIAESKYRVVSLMELTVIGYEARCYNDLGKSVVMGKYGFCEHQVTLGRDLFPDAPGQPEGSGFDEVYSDVICTALDEWLSGPVIPLDQIQSPPGLGYD